MEFARESLEAARSGGRSWRRPASIAGPAHQGGAARAFNTALLHDLQGPGHDPVVQIHDHLRWVAGLYPEEDRTEGGFEIEIEERERRWPLIFLWPKVFPCAPDPQRPRLLGG